jgi:membrane-bound lytic murein transglycosylase MltF
MHTRHPFQFVAVRLILVFFFGIGSANLAAVQSKYSITADDTGQTVLDDIPQNVKNAELSSFMGDLTGIRERRLLRVLVTHSQTDFFLEGGRIRGIQAELIHEFVNTLNKGIRRESDKLFVQFVPVEFHQLIPALRAGEGDIAAALLTITPDRAELVSFIHGQYQSIDEVIVSNINAPKVDSKGALSGKEIYVLKSSSYVEHLQNLNKDLNFLDMPEITIIESDDSLLTEDILELVNAGIIDYTVCDDLKANLWAQVLPNLNVLSDIKIAEDKNMSWAIRKNSPEMEQALTSFMKTVKRGTLMGNLLFSRYFENTKWIDNPVERLERDKLAKFIHLFERYGDMYNFDPLALAAQAYQESRLDQRMTSHKGAVGIMQVLPSTANDPNVAIANIDQVEDNIHAGTKYLRFLRERYFNHEGMAPWDRRLFSWAAYNAGPANIIRLRNAAGKNGLDPNIWFGNVEVMAARMISREPVKYVANIHKYYTAYRLIQQRSDERQQAVIKQTNAQL